MRLAESRTAVQQQRVVGLGRGSLPPASPRPCRAGSICPRRTCRRCSSDRGCRRTPVRGLLPPMPGRRTVPGRRRFRSRRTARRSRTDLEPDRYPPRGQMIQDRANTRQELMLDPLQRVGVRRRAGVARPRFPPVERLEIVWISSAPNSPSRRSRQRRQSSLITSSSTGVVPGLAPQGAEVHADARFSATRGWTLRRGDTILPPLFPPFRSETTP